jgi:hypothetical protein
MSAETQTLIGLDGPPRRGERSADTAGGGRTGGSCGERRQREGDELPAPGKGKEGCVGGERAKLGERVLQSRENERSRAGRERLRCCLLLRIFIFLQTTTLLCATVRALLLLILVFYSGVLCSS